MHPFHIGLELLKLAQFAPFSYLLFTALEFGSNHFGIIFWKIVQPHDHNEIKQPIGKIFRKYKRIRHYFVMS